MVKLLCRALLVGCLGSVVAWEGSRPAWAPPSQWSQYPEAWSEKIIALGQKLFFDPRLSGSGRTACATCHNPDFAYGDPRPVSISDGGTPGLRHAPSEAAPHVGRPLPFARGAGLRSFSAAWRNGDRH
jgi:cytochrome c peroxidase